MSSINQPAFFPKEIGQIVVQSHYTTIDEIVNYWYDNKANAIRRKIIDEYTVAVLIIKSFNHPKNKTQWDLNN